jgi:hypothetical protein
LLVGVLAQSGGFFLHLGLGREGERSAGTLVTRAGALLIAVALDPSELKNATIVYRAY